MRLMFFHQRQRKSPAGFTKEERESLIEHTNKLKLVDIIRQKHPEKDYYSYWTYMRQAREKIMVGELIIIGLLKK